jgi:hypothetical protein
MQRLCVNCAPIVYGLSMDYCALMLLGLCVDYAQMGNRLGDSIRGLCMVHSMDDAKIIHGI